MVTEGREPLISLIAPAYNEEAVLPEFVRRVHVVMTQAGLRYEIVFVNDGSTDATLSVMRQLKLAHPNITVVNLTRNFGKEAALTAGIAHGAGDAQVILDTDLQHPPELIPEMVDRWREGFDVVYGQRARREGESWLKKATARAFYRVAENLGPVPLPRDVGDFRLISRRVAQSILQLGERHRFMKGLFAWVGYPQCAVIYQQEARFAGTTKWNYWKLWKFAIEGLTSFTIAPLTAATYLGLFVALLAMTYGAYIIYRTIMFGEAVRGYPTLMVTILFLGGTQLFVVGVIGEYLGRVFNETKGRPLYLVESTAWSTSVDIDAARPLNGETRVGGQFATA